MAEKFNFDFEDIDESVGSPVSDSKPDQKYEDDFVTFWRSSGMLGVKKSV